MWMLKPGRGRRCLIQGATVAYKQGNEPVLGSKTQDLAGGEVLAQGQHPNASPYPNISCFPAKCLSHCCPPRILSEVSAIAQRQGFPWCSKMPYDQQAFKYCNAEAFIRKSQKSVLRRYCVTNGERKISMCTFLLAKKVETWQ